MTLPISYTGVRVGERIGARPGAKQNQGSILEVLTPISPIRGDIEALTETDVRDRFNTIPFFAPMTLSERWNWLLSNMVNTDGYLEDVPDLQVRVIQLSGKYFQESLTAEQINDLVNRPSILLRQLYDMLPRKPGSKARRHTLVFRPDNWILLAEEKRITSFTGLTFDIATQVVKKGPVQEDAKTRIQPLSTTRALLYPVSAAPPTWDELVKVTGYDPELMQAFRSLLIPHPPSVSKSLLQKCIRTRCREVVYEDQQFPAPVALTATLLHLLLHPGAFVPNIQKFVTGLESVTKRLAISIFEDSYITEIAPVVALMGASVLAQANRTWWPSITMIKSWLDLALQVQQEERCFDYDWHEKVAFVSTDTDILAWPVHIFDVIHGMESDRGMLVSIWNRKGRARALYQAPESFFDVMPLVHCIDQHCYTDIAYYIGFGARVPSFCDLFAQVWNLSSAYSPRKPETSVIADLAKYEDILEAQEYLWLRKSVTPAEAERVYLDTTYDFTFEYDQSWIAALVGPMEIKVGHVTALVVINCTDIHSLTAIRRPSRGHEEAVLSTEEKEQALAKAWQMLAAGVVTPPPPSSFPLTGPITVRYREEEYFLNNQPWSLVRQREYSYPVFDEPSVHVLTALTVTGDDVAAEADALLDSYLDRYPNVLQRLLYYLSDNSSYIPSPKIGRDGKGLDIPVYREDVVVHYLLSFICCLYPAALRSDSAGFVVTNGALLSILKQRVRQRLLEIAPPNKMWLPVRDYPQPLWQHQQDIIANLRHRHAAREHGSIIWLAMGMGKTACVLSYLQYLIEQEEMPDYCLYTLPPSAVDSIAKECELMAIPYQLIDMRKNSSKSVLQPALINLVVHDHLRHGSLMEQVRTIGPNLFFIVDEFHKTMNPTIRTGLALEIANVSREFIALSGSIMTSEPELLIQWLKLIVPFEVTNKNYMVAIGALVSRRVVTGIKVLEIDQSVPMAANDLYYTLVPPTLGGTGSELKFREAVLESYRLVLTEVVRLAVEHFDKKIKTFICAKDNAQQEEIRNQIMAQRPRCNIYLITSSTPITLTADKPNDIDVVITTIRLVEGYTLTDRYVAINPLVFSNQASRDQRDARLNRIGQRSPEIVIYNVHAGILTYISQRYQRIRNLAEALRAFAADVGEDVKIDLLKELQ